MNFLNEEEPGFQMWFVLNEYKIRALRDLEERKSGKEVELEIYAKWLHHTDKLPYQLNEN